jgi:hypothetical protein
VRHIARTEERRNTELQSENLKGRDHLGDLGVDDKVILQWISNRVQGCGLDLLGTGQGLVAGSYEHGNEPCFMKGGEWLD